MHKCMRIYNCFCGQLLFNPQNIRKFAHLDAFSIFTRELYEKHVSILIIGNDDTVKEQNVHKLLQSDLHGVRTPHAKVL